MVVFVIEEFKSFNWWFILLMFIFFFLGGYFLYFFMFVVVGLVMGDDLGEG